MNAFSLALWLLFALETPLPVFAATPPVSPPVFQLRLVRDGHTRFHVEAQATVAAPEAVVWNTIRDYDHLSEFVPMIVLSRRTTYQGQPAIEQIGRATFLFIRFDARAIFVEQFDPAAKSLAIHAVDGDFVRFEALWKVKPVDPHTTEITISSEAQLKRWVPRWLERWQVRKSVDHSLKALLMEMQRRATGK